MSKPDVIGLSIVLKLPNKEIHLYEIRPRKDHRGVDLVSDVLWSLFYRTCRERTILCLDFTADLE